MREFAEEGTCPGTFHSRLLSSGAQTTGTIRRMGRAQRYPSSPLPVTDLLEHRIASPINRQDSSFDISMKRRIRPTHDSIHQPMLDRIYVNIIDMPRKISIIADEMLPITPLPDSAFALGLMAGGAGFGVRQGA